MEITRISKENQKAFAPLIFKGVNRKGEIIRLGITDDNGKAAGAMCVNLSNGQADITSLYVLPGSRKQGLGKKLLNTLDELLKDEGYDAITAEYYENEALSGFFRAAGYELFTGPAHYSFSLGGLLRSPLYLKYLEDKPTKNISRISELSSKDRRAVDSYAQIKSYDMDWSTAEINNGKCMSCMLTVPLKDSVNIVWLGSRSLIKFIFLQHFRALAQKTIASYPEGTDVVFRMTFENEKLRDLIAPLLGGSSHFHEDGHLINAIKLL